MYYLGLDIGSSSIKAALVDSQSGKSLAVVSEPEVEMSMIAHQSGWAEQEPDQWWQYVCVATKRLITENSIEPSAIIGVGISYQMHGLVVVDKQGKSLRPSIIWCDSRAVEIGASAYRELGENNCASCFLNSPANFTASKLKWVAENEKELYSQIDKFMLPGDYIAYRFSDTINTTISGLSEGVLWDFKSGTVAKELMEHYGIKESMVPTLVSTFSMQSKVSSKGSLESGLIEGTPILYRAGDQPNNALSLNVLHPGEVAATGGTSGVVYAVTDDLNVTECSKVNNFAHVNYSEKSQNIGKLLCINGSGIMYRWLLNNTDATSYNEMNDKASSIEIGSNGLSVLPFGNGAERMLENKNIGALFKNLDLNIHSSSHLYRAALEGIAFSFVYGMEIMEKDGVSPKQIKAGDDNLFRSEIFAKTIATLLGVEIKIYHTTGAIGAARACSLAQSKDDVFGEQVEKNDYVMSYHPDENKEAYQGAYKRWKSDLEMELKK